MAAEPLGNIELIHGFEPPEKRKKPVFLFLASANHLFGYICPAAMSRR
jgi:hypothetical protein